MNGYLKESLEQLSLDSSHSDRVRELVIQLAIEGKLVDQDDAEGSAKLQLERISKERSKAIAGGRIRKQKSIPKLGESDRSQYPENWEVVCLAQLGEIAPRNDLDDDLDVSFLPMPLITTRLNEKLIGESRKWKDVRKGFTHLADGDVVLGKITPCFQNRKSCVIQSLESGYGGGTTELHVLRPIQELVEPRFLLLFLKSPKFIRDGISNMTGTAGQQRVSRDYFAFTPFGLPPLEEQKRIVARVDELMALIDDLEDRQERRETVRVKFRDAALNALVNADAPDELTGAWARVGRCWDSVVNYPYDVASLRRTILGLAVSGQLVPAKSFETAVENLVSYIKSRKAELIAAGEIKRAVKFDPVLQEHQQFNVPAHWVWARLGDVTVRIGSGSTPRGGKSAYVDSGIPFLRSQNVWNDGLKLDDVAYITNETHKKMSNTWVQSIDVLLNITGASLGRCALVPEELEEANVSQHVSIIRPIVPAMRQYLHMWLLSPFVQDMIWARQVGMAREGLSKKVLESFELPLPPLQEQQRIVARVDELMGLCDELEVHLKKKEGLSNLLAKSVVETA